MATSRTSPSHNGGVKGEEGREGQDAADRGRLGASTFKLLNLATLVASSFQLGVLGRSLAAGLLVLDTSLLLQGAFLSFLAALTAHQCVTAKK